MDSMDMLAGREESLRLWFDMWLSGRDTGIAGLFTEDAVYVESWGPEYHGMEKIRHWFHEWNSRGSVLKWDIRQFFHKGDQTVVEWYFKCSMKDGSEDAFEGMSLIRWSQDERIAFLKEFGCNEDRYDPYKDGAEPHFRDEKAKWF